MKSFFLSFVTCLLLLSCGKQETHQFNSSRNFTNELTALQDYFHIPGMAVAIIENNQFVYENYFGVADVETQTKLNRQSLFPIASVTKTFAAVLLLKLVEEGKLSLEDPINSFLSEPLFDATVLVKHILSHTSQGDIGKQFYYSFRFGVLTKVIEKVTGMSFENAMQQYIFNPIELQQTFLLKDAAQLAQKNIKLVSPYIFDEETKTGFIDYGYSTAAGIVSNLDDLVKFSTALEANLLLSEASKNTMFSPLEPNLPYAFGIFKQQFQNTEMLWSYGQYDCYASLLLKVPAKDITLIILANNNLMSDAARLINGDITSSLFALSFLKNYIFKDATLSLFEPKDSITQNIKNPEFYRKKLLAEAMASAFMARFDNEKFHHSIQLLKKVLQKYPDYHSYADLNVLHTLSFLKTVAFYKELGAMNDFDTHIEVIAKKLLTQDAANPYANYYLANFYAGTGELEKARRYFENIVQAKNFSKWWYTIEAENWLREHP
jgi:CubicO group peptidase (beta-lactamase class C family)